MMVRLHIDHKQKYSEVIVASNIAHISKSYRTDLYDLKKKHWKEVEKKNKQVNLPISIVEISYTYLDYSYS